MLIALSVETGILILNLKKLPTRREVGKMFLVFFLLLPTMFPQAGLRIFFGRLGSVTNDFTLVHRLTVYFSFLIMPVIYIFMKNESMDNKRLLLVVLSISSVFQFLYVKRDGLAGCPSISVTRLSS